MCACSDVTDLPGSATERHMRPLCTAILSRSTGTGLVFLPRTKGGRIESRGCGKVRRRLLSELRRTSWRASIYQRELCREFDSDSANGAKVFDMGCAFRAVTLNVAASARSGPICREHAVPRECPPATIEWRVRFDPGWDARGPMAFAVRALFPKL